MEQKKIYAALLAAQKEISHAEKNSTNPHFRSRYADLESVIESCKPQLNKHGLVFLQLSGRDDFGHYIETVIAHESGETVSGKTYLELTKHDMQGLGSAITYARRYGLMSICGMATEDDDGNEAAKKQPQISDAERYQKLPQETKAIFDGLSTSKDMAPRYKYCAGLGWDTGKIHADLLKKSDAAKEKAIKENF